jgi:hypothetical protein
MLTEQSTYASDAISKELQIFTNQMYLYDILKSTLFSFPMELSRSNVYYSQHRSRVRNPTLSWSYEENA